MPAKRRKVLTTAKQSESGTQKKAFLISSAAAKAELSSLIKRAQRGERITITHYNRPVVDLVPTEESTYPVRRFGTGKGNDIILDSDWARGVETEEELAAWLRGEF